MSDKTVYIVGGILLLLGGVVYFMPGFSAKSDALTWFGIVGFVFLFGVVVNYIRKKRGSQ